MRGGRSNWRRVAGTLGLLFPTGLVAAWLLAPSERELDPDLAQLELEPWEIEALRGPAVGSRNDHGHDEPPAGSGDPADFCVPQLGEGLAGQGEEPWTCPVDPVTSPEWAPVPRGAPFAKRPSSIRWPVISKHQRRRVVSYWASRDGKPVPLGDSGRSFGSLRVDEEEAEDGTLVEVERGHAGLDLFAKCEDVVVAPEDGRILGYLKFNQGTWACYLRSSANDQVICLGELEFGSWKKLRNALGEPLGPGIDVLEGQRVGTIGRQGSTCMLHVEIYDGAGLTDDEVMKLIRSKHFRWTGSAAPTRLLDGSPYWLTASTEQYRRDMVFG